MRKLRRVYIGMVDGGGVVLLLAIYEYFLQWELRIKNKERINGRSSI